MEKEELEKILIVGAKIRIGKRYAKEYLCEEGEILELVEGYFEEYNGLFFEDETAPAVWDDKNNEYDSIYHLFGNNLGEFYDCEVIQPNERDKQ